MGYLDDFAQMGVIAHMKKFIFLMSISLMLAGCAGTQSYLRILENNGTVTVDLSDDPTYDYKVKIKNAIDFDWSGDNEADRLETIDLMFKETCDHIEVIDQIPIKTGKYNFPRGDAITWVMKVKCND